MASLTNPSNPDSSIESIDEDVDHSSKGHLAVVFFDVLYLDGRDLTNEPLCRRRNLLEKIVRKVPQFVSALCDYEGCLTSAKSMLSHIDRIDIRDFNKGMSVGEITERHSKFIRYSLYSAYMRQILQTVKVCMFIN